MRIIMVPVGSAGDVHPHVGIGLALQRRGHDVSVLTSVYFQPLLSRVGLPLIPVGTVDDYHRTLEHPDLWRSHRGLNVIGEAIRQHGSEISRLLREQADGAPPLLVAHPLAVAARLAHETLGLPLVTLHLQPTGFVSEHDTAVPHLWLRSINRWPRPVKRLLVTAGDRLSDRALAPAVNDLRAEFGLSPVRNIVREWWHSPQRVIGLFPDWYAPVQPDWPQQTSLTSFPLYDEGDATPLSSGLAAWLDAGEPPVVFAPGTANRQAARFFQAGADACRRLGRRGLLLSRFAEQIPDPLPPGVRHDEYAPFGSLLSRSAALVHHGGIGTAAQALRAGCPHLVMPMAFDQPDNALRLQRLGVGRYLRPSRFTARAVARELDALLGSEEVARACRAVASRFVGIDPVAQTCDLIEAAA
jgi:UDP:flavonoid glycosyltransferase YjiC (YdhE family)